MRSTASTPWSLSLCEASIHRCSWVGVGCGRAELGFAVGRGGGAGLAARGVPLWFLLVPGWLVGRWVQPCGGPVVWANSVVQAASQGQAWGRCSRVRRPEDAMRAGTVISFRRMVAVVAFARAAPAMVAAARERLKAMTARTSHAAFAVKIPSVVLSPADAPGLHA